MGANTTSIREILAPYLQDFERVERRKLVKVVDKNLFELAQALDATIFFKEGKPWVKIDDRREFTAGDLVDPSGFREPTTTFGNSWYPVEQGDLINKEDLR